MSSNAQLRDVLLAVRKDEEDHRDVNHQLADKLANERTLLINLELELAPDKTNSELKIINNKK